MSDKLFNNPYDDENTPKVDLPQNKSTETAKSGTIAEPLPESSRPRKDGPGGE